LITMIDVPQKFLQNDAKLPKNYLIFFLFYFYFFIS
jgi:hypothetical protein